MDYIKNAVEQHKNLIQPPFDTLYQITNYESLDLLFNEFGGAMLYIPRTNRAIRECIAAQVNLDFYIEGSNLKELSKRYQVSVRTVREMLDNTRLNML
jgi:Mor family transcriptional regulator